MLYNIPNALSIIITGAPDFPTALLHNVSANTESSAVIQWQPPLYTGGRGISIINYMVTASDQTTLVHGDMLTYTVTGLDVNTDFIVKVTAVNSCAQESIAATVTVNIEAKG